MAAADPVEVTMLATISDEEAVVVLLGMGMSPTLEIMAAPMVASAVEALKALDFKAMATLELGLAIGKEMETAPALAIGREVAVTATMPGKGRVMVSASTTTSRTPVTSMLVVVLMLLATTTATAEVVVMFFPVVVSTVVAVVSPMEVQPSTSVVAAAPDAPPMVVTMEPVPPLPAAASVLHAHTTKAVDHVLPKKTKKKDKNANKVKCFRCGIAGHYSIECTVPICDFCESADHANADCHLHSAPKPTLFVYGYAHEELVFFDIQNSESYRPRSDNGRMGRITVTSGTLTSDEIIVVLRGLVLDDQFLWDIKPQGNNIYKTQFPSKMELARATCFGTFLAK
ncbi:hypothetical protein ACQ4PT_048860 [Festuca glaucescens]